ncbi:FtsX-like permease family protein [Bacillus sp. TE8-1]|uniref:FtsX-like permease family protein n=1 Tax=Bacillus sp. TE8-1 TaxID=2217829 RepID=UPI0011EF6434|nr:FtsX-like permease family protein [Bacillus sp. TE8-1]KAA0780964.1 ABC transporter permease [Bacillus sp. TE8-1]
MKFWQFALKNVVRNSHAYFAYFLSSTFSIAVFFSFAVYVFHPQLQKVKELEEHQALINMSKSAQIIIIVFSFLFLLYSINTFFKVRKKQFGILSILGISNKQLKQLLFIENMFIGILSIFTGIQVGLVFFYFFLLITSKLTGAKDLYLYWPIKACLVTTVIFIILFIIVSTLTPIFIRNRKTKRLMEGNHLKKEEKKPSVLLLFCCLACLGGSYYIAGNTDWYMKQDSIANTYTVYIIISIIPLVAIGTYLLFSQVAFWCIRLLKKSRKFYMKRSNMLWISDLATRTRGNINMLFIVTMLTACAFTIITALFAMNNYTKSGIIKDYPIPFTYISYENNPIENKHITTIEKELKHHQFQYKKYKSMVLKDKIFDREITIMKESNYNALSKLLHRQEIKLANTEVIITSSFLSNVLTNPFVKQDFITLDSNNTRFSIKSFLPKAIEPFQEVVVMKDIIFDTMIPHLETATIYNYFVDNWESSLIPTTKMLKVINQDSEKFLQSREGNQNIPFSIYTASDALHVSKQDKTSAFFIGTFLGVIFFIGAASVLYFRMYTDLTHEEMKYITIIKIGLTDSEMFRSATIQLAILFFVPYVIAAIHTIFAIKFLQSQSDFPLLKELGIVLCFFGIVEMIFFFLLRSFYINKLSKHINL